jgi:hypothetical protein
LRRKAFLFGVATFLSVSTFFYSCKNDEERLGLSGGNDPDVIVIDTFTVLTRTVPEDSFATHRLSLNILGALNSTTYGKSSADVVVDFGLPDINNFEFPAGSVLDSAFLVLQYAGTSLFDGDLSTTLNINAYELSERVYLDSVYYSNEVFQINPTPISTANTTLNLFDSVSVTFKGDVTKQAPQLRLRLNNTFGNKIVSGSASNFASNIAFKDFIRGIRITAENSTLGANGGVAAYLDLLNNVSGIHVYYNDTQSVVFPINDPSAIVSTYKHDFAGTPIETQFNNPADYNTCYLQSMAGSRIRVDIPGLQNIALDDNYAVVGANIEFTPDGIGVGTGFEEPSRLLFLARDSNNQGTLVVDALNEPLLYNGNYNSSEMKYEFNFPRHVQLIQSELKQAGRNINNGFFIRIPADRPITAGRLPVNTQKNVPRGIRFKLHVIKVR